VSSQAGAAGAVAQAGAGGAVTQAGTGGSPSHAGAGGTTASSGTAGQATAGQTSTAGSAGASTGGTAAGGASAGTGGAGGSAGSGSGGATQSGGCGKTRTLQNGNLTISFGGASRKYILRVPDGYDNTHPYRLVFAFAESGSSAMSVATRNYFTLATLDSKNTIFVAPDAANGMGSWSKADVELTDAILAQVQGDLCIDKSRIFATGFSFGGAMSIALACTRADVFRGVAFFSGADLTGSCPATLTKPIAYYASQASGDSSGDPMPSSGRVKQAQFAAVNGCTAEPSATTFPAPGQPHKCTDYKGCSAGHPTKYCVFDGPHGWEPKDPGQSMSWNAPEAWKFITQF
jgi:poly(3-hydroxybutyrate) depolymerase